MRKNRTYGWVPQLPDHRDLKFSRTITSLPGHIYLPNVLWMPPIYDQGQLGSCTANAIAAAVEIERVKQKLPDIMPSRLMIYYDERVIEGTVSSDSGAMIRDGIKSVNTTGVCPELQWPYNISEFAVQPPQAAYAAALKDRALKYEALDNTNLAQLQTCLALAKPFVAGFTVYDSFESDQVAATGIVPMPGPTENITGGHAVLVIGYNNAEQRFLVRNSWGTSWGLPHLPGHFTIPFDYFTSPDLASDFWAIDLIGPQ